ncbi:MAG: exosortase/archaeosortase family protein [Candidatus Synoicihabitans palmerolidicus]|nr:exosortase/archaeosortase family protein [Candidatus Synoicihabitans palmerolidicus]
MHALGYAVQQTRISIGAVLLFTGGVLRLGGGPRWGRAVVFPLALMLFAMPWEVLDAVRFHLRLGVIATTELMARWVGIEVVRNGTQLFSPDGSYQYDVAAACSGGGADGVDALLALSALVGYLGLRSNWRRLGVFLLASPLTLAGNVVRITAVVLAGEWVGQRAGEVLHHWAGFVVFLIVLGGVQLAVAWLERGDKNPMADGAGSGREKVCHVLRDKRSGRGGIWVWVGGVVAVVTVVTVGGWSGWMGGRCGRRRALRWRRTG